MTAPLASATPTGGEALRRGTITLRAAGVEESALEAELLLRHVLGQDKTCFYLQLPDRLSARQNQVFLSLLQQRLAHRPLAYLTGQRAFFDVELHVAPGVLIPRPETELVVEQCLVLLRSTLAEQGTARFVDVGTGSGAIALVIARQLPQVEVTAVDISPEALAIAGLNARRLRLSGRIRFVHSDLLAGVPGAFDVIAANLPYVPTPALEGLPPEIRDNEPRLALDGGIDGLDVIRRLIAGLPARLSTGGAAVLEIGAGQAQSFSDTVAAAALGSVEILRDLAGIERVAVIRV